MENLKLVSDRYTKAKTDFDQITSKRLSKFTKCAEKSGLSALDLQSKEDFLKS